MSFCISTTISISHKKLNCEKVAEFLGKIGIQSDVTRNISYQKTGIEEGCRLVQTMNSRNDICNIWELLKNEYGLTCAHLNVNGKYDGCILNYLAPSVCPLQDIS